MRAETERASRKRRPKKAMMKRVYKALPSVKSRAITSKAVSEKISEKHATVCSLLSQLEEGGHITKVMQKDIELRDITTTKGHLSREINKSHWYIRKGNVEMSLNLEGLRKESAKAIYESIRAQAGDVGMVPWHQVNPEHKRGFEKMAGVIFDVLFRKHPDDLIAFFTDGRAD